MKKTLTALLLAALPLIAGAQAKFGYVSYSEALKSMPEYAIAQANVENLKTQYESEMKRVEDEFNKKYEIFLEEQKDLAAVILHKRQSELQEIMEKNIAFKQEAARLLKAAEADAFAPLKTRLNTVISNIGAERGYDFVLNTDADACPYINPETGEDITDTVKNALARQ